MTSRRLIAFGFAAVMIPCLARGELPQHDGYEHLGVQSCGASSCHGSASVRNTYAVLQNEYITWARHDLHARAYTVLKNEQSQRIAENLGLEAAHTAKICLDCHSDYVPRERRGLQFQLSDGVACEACHGGAEKWLGVHISGGGNKHAESRAAGLYPTEDPEARAELCLSCHLGTRDKFATHEIMGAGHPRLSFDLQKFTDIQPRHFRIDKDYRKRKNPVEDTRAWAIGQVSASRHYMSLLQGPRVAGGGVFPELALFDCHACHHSFKEQRWKPNERTATPPGTVLLNDSSLAMSHIIAGVVTPGASNSLLSAIRELHLASQTDVTALRAAAAKLDRQLAQLADSLRNQKFGRKQNKRMMDALVSAVAEMRFTDYSDAEQATMALDVYSGVTGKYKNELDALYETVADVEVTASRFDPTAFAAVFGYSSTAADVAVTRQPERIMQRPAPVARVPDRVVPAPTPVPQEPERVVTAPMPVPREPGRTVTAPAPVARTTDRAVTPPAPVVPPESSAPPVAQIRPAPTQTVEPVQRIAVATTPADGAAYVVNTDALRVRFRPQPDAGVRSLLYYRHELQLLNRSGEWSRVAYIDADGVAERGWVASDLIVEAANAPVPRPKPAVARAAARSFPPTTTESSFGPVEATHRVNAGALRIRYTADANAGVLGTLYFGDDVQVLLSSGQWSRVLYTAPDGATRRGWVAADFLDPL